MSYRAGVGMTESDRELGMGRDIARRDFIHGVTLASLALSMPGCWDPEAGTR